MNKKYELTMRIKNGMEERDFGVYKFNLISWKEAFQVRDLSVFKDDCYIVFSLDEVEDKESNA